MKKIISAVIIVFLSVGHIGVFGFNANEDNDLINANEHCLEDIKEWTIMFYDDADFTPGYDPFNDFISDALATITGEKIFDAHNIPKRDRCKNKGEKYRCQHSADHDCAHGRLN